MARSPQPAALAALDSVSITQFKQNAREVINRLASKQPVAIRRHKAADAVLISPDDYLEFVALRRERLDSLAARYDALVTRMQGRASAAGVDALFGASSEDLGRAAVAALKGD